MLGAYLCEVDEPTRHELEATVAARRELGPAHDKELIDGFLDRIEKEIDRRVDERVASRVPSRKGGSPLHPANLAICIPIIAVAGGVGGGLPGVIAALIALAFIFLVAEKRR